MKTLAVILWLAMFALPILMGCTPYKVESQTVCAREETVWECHKQGFLSRKIVKICTDEATCNEKCGKEYK
jgi:hypothetical protein